MNAFHEKFTHSFLSEFIRDLVRSKIGHQKGCSGAVILRYVLFLSSLRGTTTMSFDMKGIFMRVVCIESLSQWVVGGD